MIVGIDYGSKVAGTTVICYPKNETLVFHQSKKKEDADKMIIEWVEQNTPSVIMLDAPLSLPKVYTKPSSQSSYHYRECDRELKAMSPMFLGGLTARAMQLRANLSAYEIYETYPKQVLNHRFADLKEFYKDDIELFSAKLSERLPLPFHQSPKNWHQVDSSLAWYAGYLFDIGTGDSVGDNTEGVILY